MKSGSRAPALEQPRGAGPCVWAVGGGKGGVGKSVVTSSLAIALARRGERCVLIDADLGGANLHTILGMRPPRQSLTHFFTGEAKQLEDVACPGPVPNLQLISGAQALLEIANPSHSRKEKLLRHIHRLDVDHVFLDLGAGSSFTVLDFFLTASRGILIVVPEPTSIENAYYFLKAAFFRSLRQVAQRGGMREVVLEALRQRSQRPASPRELLALVQEIDPSAGSLFGEEARRFRPMLIVNQARTQEHRRIGSDISVACREYLGVELEPLGALERDECVRAAVSERVPVLMRFPASCFARDLSQLAERMAGSQAQPRPASSEDPECSFRYGRLIYGRTALVACGLVDEPGSAEPEAPEDSAAAEAAPEIEPVSAPEPAPAAALAEAALPPLDLTAPGDHLRRCRIARGLELAECARKLRILCLDAIERERFEGVPPEPFIRGFVKSYAQFLGIEGADSLAAAFVGRYRMRSQQRRLCGVDGIRAA